MVCGESFHLPGCDIHTGERENGAIGGERARLEENEGERARLEEGKEEREREREMEQLEESEREREMAQLEESEGETEGKEAVEVETTCGRQYPTLQCSALACLLCYWRVTTKMSSDPGDGQIF